MAASRRWPWEPLEAYCEATFARQLSDDGTTELSLVYRLSVATGVPCSRLYRARSDGSMTEHLADRVATRLGLHPCRIWPDWFNPIDIAQEDKEPNDDLLLRAG